MRERFSRAEGFKARGVCPKTLNQGGTNADSDKVGTVPGRLAAFILFRGKERAEEKVIRQALLRRKHPWRRFCTCSACI